MLKSSPSHILPLPLLPGFYPEEMREMRNPSSWPTVMHWTYGLVLPLYWVCGVLGYYAYGDYSLANINLNFPKNNANLASISVQLVRKRNPLFTALNCLQHSAVYRA
jgi:amino acid permease